MCVIASDISFLLLAMYTMMSTKHGGVVGKNHHTRALHSLLLFPYKIYLPFPFQELADARCLYTDREPCPGHFLFEMC